MVRRNFPLRLPATVHDEANRQALSRKISLNTLISDAVTAALADNSIGGDRTSLAQSSEDQLIDILASSVAEHLRHNPSWAKTIIRHAQLRWPGGVLQTRMADYALEKRFLATKLSAWLGRRILHLMDHEKLDVAIMIDAGSSNLWFCRFLWNHLAQISTTVRRSKVTLITNSVPVAENFSEQCELGRFAGHTTIRCELLGGTMQPRYGAVVGPITQANLKEYSKEARTKYIALSAGNFVRLETGQPSYPVPLIRGEGQKEVKELYIKTAHEVFVLAPLGKLFLKGTDQINKQLKLSNQSKQIGSQPYEAVNIDDQDRAKLKVVTTKRNSSKSILSRHSSVIHALLQSDPSGESTPTGDINSVRNFCYEYDEHINGKTPEEQCEIEFPHKATRGEQFMKDFFEVDLK
jgi:hypothetical protein